MSNRRSGRLAVALLTLIFAVPSGLAQKKNGEKAQDPSEKTRNVKPELNKAYKDWLEKDVAYIITDEERKAFKKLQTDDERERFIRSEEHTSELQSHSELVCRLLLEKKTEAFT